MTTPAPFIPMLTEISALKGKLLHVPDALLKARLALAEAQDRERDAGAAVAEAKAEVEYAVINAVDPTTGKSLHANEAARKAALAKALGEDAAYRAALKEAGLAQSERTQTALDVQRLEDEQRALRAVSDLVCQEVALLIAGR